MSLSQAQKTLIRKNQLIDRLVAQFTARMEIVNASVRDQLASLIRAGNYTREDILNLFAANGYDEVVAAFTDNYVKMINESKQLAEQMGLSFAINESGIDILTRMQELQIATLITQKETIANAMMQAGIRSESNGWTLKQIIGELSTITDDATRRLGTEAVTGISLFDRAIKSEQYKEAGIEKFVYVGPLDNVTRQSCADTLNDPRQQTGWTRDEIDSSEVDFIAGGGYNCRHEWIAYVEGVDKLLTKMEQEQ